MCSRACKRINVDAFEWHILQRRIEEADVLVDCRGLDQRPRTAKDLHSGIAATRLFLNAA
jgi:hypothetical protein